MFETSPIRSCLVPKFKLRKTSEGKELVQDGVVNFSQRVESYRESAVDRILDRFLNEGEQPSQSLDPESDALGFMRDVLDDASAMIENLEDARDELGLSPDLDYSAIVEEVQKRYEASIKTVDAARSAAGGSSAASSPAAESAAQNSEKGGKE